jgi:fatty acid desaturase
MWENKIPKTFNALMTITLAALLPLHMIVFIQYADTTLLKIAVLISYNLFFVMNYGLYHEGSHFKLHPKKSINRVLSETSSLNFLVPFAGYAETHWNHHLRNRTDFECFDIVQSGDSKIKKFINWYGFLMGLYYWLYIPVTFILTLFPQFAKVVSSKKISAGNLKANDLDGQVAKESLIGLVFILSFWSAILYFTPITIGTFVIFYFFGSLLWSTTQYVDHAYSERDVVWGAHNLKLPTILSYFNLGREFDLNHHLDPRIPWSELRKNPFKLPTSGNYIHYYFKQWLGPEIPSDGGEMAKALSTKELLSVLRIERKKLKNLTASNTI